MARKIAQPPEPQKPNLVVTRAEAESQIKKQLEKLENLLANCSDLDQAKTKLDQLAKYNKELLGRILDNDVIANEYDEHIRFEEFRIDSFGSSYFNYNPGEPLEEKFRQKVQVHIAELKSIVERLELIPELPRVPAVEESNKRKRASGSDIFIVHGHDEAAKEKVAGFIRALGLNPVILHEKPNKGRTVIEKFEDYANVGFAVVLLTPDDVGAAFSDKDNLCKRARQNVVFELGFFLGKLGRERVCALHKRDVEIFSDYSGVLFVPMDENDGWKLKLAKEIKAAGIPVDLNKAI